MCFVCSRVIWLELIHYFFIKLLTDTDHGVNIKFLNNAWKPVCTICLNFLPRNINSCENFVEAAIYSIVLFYNQWKSTQKILSVKTHIRCRGIFRTHSSNYHGAFLQKNLTSFSHRTNPPEVFYKNSWSKLCMRLGTDSWSAN